MIVPEGATFSDVDIKTMVAKGIESYPELQKLLEKVGIDISKYKTPPIVVQPTKTEVVTTKEIVGAVGDKSTIEKILPYIALAVGVGFLLWILVRK